MAGAEEEEEEGILPGGKETWKGILPSPPSPAASMGVLQVWGGIEGAGRARLFPEQPLHLGSGFWGGGPRAAREPSSSSQRGREQPLNPGCAGRPRCRDADVCHWGTELRLQGQQSAVLRESPRCAGGLA